MLSLDENKGTRWNPILTIMFHYPAYTEAVDLGFADSQRGAGMSLGLPDNVNCLTLAPRALQHSLDKLGRASARMFWFYKYFQSPAR